MAQAIYPKLQLDFNDYKDSVYACWIGKNIGGTIGAPFEGTCHTLNIDGFTSEPGEPLPNDDLDLQLVWLHGVEALGARAIDTATLGELWIGLIPPNWNEYGIGKNNIRRGLQSPLSGDYENPWKHSNGAWIRTEIWACLAPASPAIAAKYAIEDGKVDHGAGEGTIAAAFVAAMQSAAFVVKDIRKCIEIGLSAISDTSRVADSIRFIITCYENGMTSIDSANAIQQRNSDIGTGWFEAPSNIAYAVIGLLWGEGDFKKSIITAINCGDDTDCTGATVGATLGILGGTKIIPADWQKHIGDKIVTISINRGDIRTGGSVPKTCKELTQRVAKQTPHFLFETNANVCFGDFSGINEEILESFHSECVELSKTCNLLPFCVHFKSTLIYADVIIENGVNIKPNEQKKITVKLTGNPSFGDEFKNINMRWWLPNGFTVTGRQSWYLPNSNRCYRGKADLDYIITTGDTIATTNRCVLEIIPEGRSIPLYIPILLLG